MEAASVRDHIYQPINPERVVNLNLLEVQAHLCYLCGNLAQDPYQCPGTFKDGKCQAMYCYHCLKHYLEKERPSCPKCRSMIMDPKVSAFRKPATALYQKHMTGIYIKCRNTSCLEAYPL
jgi:hypothetical protein